MGLQYKLAVTVRSAGLQDKDEFLGGFPFIRGLYR